MAINLATVPTDTVDITADRLWFVDISEAPDAPNQIVIEDLLGASLSAIRGLSPAEDDVLQFKSGEWDKRTIAQLKTDVFTGAVDMSSSTSLKIPTSAAPTVDANGKIALDTTVTDFSHGVLKYYGGEEMVVIAVPIAEVSSMSNGDVIKYNATNDEFEIAAASGGITNGAGNNVVTKSDGTNLVASQMVDDGTTVKFGTNAATSGIIAIPNNVAVKARNNANGADLPLISLNTSDQVIIGQQGTMKMVSDGAREFFQTSLGSDGLTVQFGKGHYQGFEVGGQMAVTTGIGGSPGFSVYPTYSAGGIALTTFTHLDAGVAAIAINSGGSTGPVIEVRNSTPAVIAEITSLGYIRGGKVVVAKTADYTVTATTDVGKVFTNEGAGSPMNFSLPGAVKGLTYTFFCYNGVGVTITAAAGDTIQFENSVSATGGTADNTNAGNFIELLAINTTEWVTTSYWGTWTIT